MESRREFLKKMALLSGAVGTSVVFPESIQKALAIDPKPGSTYLDAEHVVLLMQENRSFDHCYGCLRGVRGYNDPRAVSLPNKNLVWLQKDTSGETYAPFRLDIKDTKATWMGSLPHSRTSQIDAWNDGKYDQWIEAKRSGWKEYSKMPLTMGHYTREDIPFYYALADAFTVCDQHFCASLTPTTPNRLFFWTGTVRERQNPDAKAFVRNKNVDFETADWSTYPEQLEKNGISWKVYQNELYIDTGFTGEEGSWLENFGDNPLEYFSQYHVKLSANHIRFLEKQLKVLPEEIEQLKKQDGSDENRKKLKEMESFLEAIKKELAKSKAHPFRNLSDEEKALHEKAFTINNKDPYYRELAALSYSDNGTERKMKVPKGDVLHRFREDVKNGNLPMVSWIVAPEKFSDHPDSPWYGAWYVSEVMDILTQNPEVWKKTIFILTYDENDGYFDHVPPFVCPNPEDPETGITSKGLNDGLDYVQLEQELHRDDLTKEESRGGPVGLGYRVPMVVASPWSRGGWVNSEIFDHTSSLQFLETFLREKYGKDIRETNISKWRRTVSGDLTSVFREYSGDKKESLPFLSRDPFVESIYNAKFQKEPTDYKELNAEEIRQINEKGSKSSLMPQQEKGIRPACPTPYQIDAVEKLSRDKKSLNIIFRVDNKFGGKESSGSAFNVYAPGKYRKMIQPGKYSDEFEDYHFWSFAVASGDRLNYSWPLMAFENGIYHLRVNGPNGFYRELMGSDKDPDFEVGFQYSKNVLTNRPSGNVELVLENNLRHASKIEIIDHSYRQHNRHLTLRAKGIETIKLDLSKTYGWYDFSVKIEGHDHFERRYAGHVETGKPSYSDPAMGRMV